ncbi:MAG: hypothetical protein V3S02_02860 [Dehalococcoidales bacterium]
MKSETKGGELDELMALSRGMSQTAKKLEQEEQRGNQRRQKLQGVQQGLRGISVSVALSQLQTIASPDIVSQVDSLNSKRGTADLRRLIVNMAHDLEKCVGNPSATTRSKMTAEDTAATLAILIELLFSLE